MSFFDEEKAGQSGRRFRSWDETFIRFTPDYTVTVQILEPDASKNILWQHFIPQARKKDGGRGVSVQCPGIDICPICQRNKDLERDHPDYIKPQKRHYVNVLDLTPRKTCPLCETVTYNSDKCSYCDSSLTDVEPSEPMVKLMERGVELFRHIATVEKSITKPYDPNDETLDADVVDYSRYNPGEPVPVGVTHYPLTLVTDAQTRRPIPIAGEVNDLNWRDYVDEHITVQEAYIMLKPFEIEELLRGGSLSEVLKARYQDDEEPEEFTGEVSDDIIESF